MKIFVCKIFYFFIFLFFFNIKTEINNFLHEILLKKFDEESIKGKKSGDYTKTKIKNLNFNELCILYLLLIKENKNENKLILLVLQRMYLLCSDSKLGEFILWELANFYEKQKNYFSAYEMFGIFKKLFPGSNFYLESRLKEIENLFKINLNFRLDDGNNQIIINLCRQYEYDKQNSYFENDNNIDSTKILFMMQKAYINSLKKIIFIAKNYLTKYKYMTNSDVLFSVIQRLFEFSNLIDEAILFDLKTNEKEFSEKYKSILLNEKEKIENFFQEEELFLPEGKFFIEERNKIMIVLDKNSKKIKDKLSKIISNSILNLNKF